MPIAKQYCFYFHKLCREGICESLLLLHASVWFQYFKRGVSVEQIKSYYRNRLNTNRAAKIVPLDEVPLSNEGMRRAYFKKKVIDR